jgi:uncharacterized protein (DUF362 family)/NAD-dependent dihydropyrimidine dehydrogenase PreA subunit
MARHVFGGQAVDVHEAWTLAEIRGAVGSILDDWEPVLEAAGGPPGASSRAETRVVLKPNLNNDLCALTGNCTDLRLLGALLEGLKARGFARIVVADGSNVGIDRRGIDAFRRLRVDRLCRRHDADLLDLNAAPGSPVTLKGGGKPSIAHVIREAELLISVPTIKTHAEMAFSSAMKNWVGLARGQDKRQVHCDLAANIVALNTLFRPHLIVVDGIVGMEGNGPGDGSPFRLGRILAGTDAFLMDLVSCRLVAMPWRDVPYLALAEQDGHVSEALARDVEDAIAVLRPIERAPGPSFLARVASSPRSRFLKPVVRLVSDRPVGTYLAYRLNAIQDVYDRTDDTLRVVGRHPDRCRACSRCADFCPTGLDAREIGVKRDLPDCIQCLYCWFACPEGAIRVAGERGAMARQIKRYKARIEGL